LRKQQKPAKCKQANGCCCVVGCCKAKKKKQMQEFFSKHFFHQKKGRIGKRRSVLPWLKLQTSEQVQAG
jgi:hypothetical protein